MTDVCLTDGSDFATLPWHNLEGERVLVTGATGLVGSRIVRTLYRVRQESAVRFGVVALSRNPLTARAAFPGIDESFLSFEEWHAGEPVPLGVDAAWAVHAASPTASEYFVEHPVETIYEITCGTQALLEFTRAHSGRLVVLSSMESYGAAGGLLSEDAPGVLDPALVRSSYPEAKRLVECLCVSYASEYGVGVSVVRLAQCFGGGVRVDDQRVFAHIGRCVLQGSDISLETDGSKRNPYISLADAASAVLFALLRGADGAVYNAANSATCCSVREMALLVARKFGHPGMRVTYGTSKSMGQYRPHADFDMDCSNLAALGWRATEGLEEMYADMLSSWHRAAGLRSEF